MAQILDFETRVRERVASNAEVHRQRDAAWQALPVIADTIKSLRSLHVDNRHIARLLRHVANDLDRGNWRGG